jgi:hypothetical protein
MRAIGGPDGDQCSGTDITGPGVFATMAGNATNGP